MLLYFPGGSSPHDDVPALSLNRQPHEAIPTGVTGAVLLDASGSVTNSHDARAPNALSVARATGRTSPNAVDPVAQPKQEVLGNRNKTKVFELDLAQATIDKLTAELEHFKTDMERRADAFESLEKQYNLLKEKYDLKCALLDSLAASRSLGTPEHFSMKFGDEVLGEEVRYGLGDINAQILAIADTVSDANQLRKWFGRPQLAFEKRPTKLSEDETSNLRKIVGKKLLAGLPRLSYADDQVSLRLSMQAIICFFVAKLCETYPYSPMRGATSGKGALWEVYPDVHNNEIQTVAARWRAIGSKYSKTPGAFTELLVGMTTCTLQYLSRVLLVAGVHTDLTRLQKFCEHCVGDSLQVMWSVALQYAETLKERVFSTDYCVTCIVSDDENVYDPNYMRTRGSTIQSGQVVPEGKVSCTVELGLRQTTNLAKLGELAKGRVRTDVIIKPVVILDYKLETMPNS